VRKGATLEDFSDELEWTAEGCGSSNRGMQEDYNEVD
jgi:hypothetical protein